MSLIADALKQAQEQRRPGAGDPDKARRMLSGAGPLRVEASGRPEVTRPLAAAGLALAAAVAIFGAVVILSPETRLVSTTAFADPAPRPASDRSLEPGELPQPEMSTLTQGGDPAGSAGPPTFSEPPAAERAAADMGYGPADPPAGDYQDDAGPAGVIPPMATAPVDAGADAAAGGGPGSFRLELSGGDGPRMAGDGFALGVAAQRRGEHDVAVHYYREALAAAPDDPQIHNNLGTAYRALGRTEQALAAFEAAVAVDPSYAPAWSNLGVMLDRMARGQEAASAYREALRLDPGNAAARVNLAIRYHATGLVADALGLLNDVLRDDPALPEANYAMARLLDDQGDAVGAVRHYRLFLNAGRSQFSADLEAQVVRRIETLEARGGA